jgi:hypothetical protein
VWDPGGERLGGGRGATFRWGEVSGSARRVCAILQPHPQGARLGSPLIGRSGMGIRDRAAPGCSPRSGSTATVGDGGRRGAIERAQMVDNFIDLWQCVPNCQQRIGAQIILKGGPWREMGDHHPLRPSVELMDGREARTDGSPWPGSRVIPQVDDSRRTWLEAIGKGDEE